MRQRLMTGIQYLYDRDGVQSVWLNDGDTDDFYGIVRAVVSFAGWHTIEVAFDLQPNTAPRCIELSLKVSVDGPARISPADMRELSVPDLVDRVSPVATAQPARTRVDADRLRQVADIYTAGGEAITEIRRQLHVSRSRAYALVSQAREAGLLTEESTQ